MGNDVLLCFSWLRIKADGLGFVSVVLPEFPHTLSNKERDREQKRERMAYNLLQQGDQLSRNSWFVKHVALVDC